MYPKPEHKVLNAEELFELYSSYFESRKKEPANSDVGRIFVNYEYFTNASDCELSEGV